MLRSNITIDGAGYTLQCIGTLSTGIYVESASNVTIKNAKIKDFDTGISFFGSEPALKFSNVVGNYIANNYRGINGVGFSYSITGNNIINNTQGINLSGSSNNTIAGNNIISNDNGIGLGWSSNNSIFGNNIEGNWYGISLSDSSNNSIIRNNLTANSQYGIMLSTSSGNRFHHNNFINNTWQVDTYADNNTWDDGYHSGGNYWSDYTGVDINHDGIGDTPYVIDANNTDHYPLVVPTAIPEFPSFLVLPIFMIATLLAVIVYSRKQADRR